MADEEFERYKNFILEQQAQSVVRHAQIESNMARFEEELSRLTIQVRQLRNFGGRFGRSTEGRNGEPEL